MELKPGNPRVICVSAKAAGRACLHQKWGSRQKHRNRCILLYQYHYFCYLDIFISFLHLVFSELGNKMTCVLCHRPDETENTGTLSSKENVAAHQNCLVKILQNGQMWAFVFGSPHLAEIWNASASFREDGDGRFHKSNGSVFTRMKPRIFASPEILNIDYYHRTTF